MNEVILALGRLCERVNVMTRYPFEGQKLVILYDDHRWLLNVFFKILKDSLLPAPPKLVFFDSHDDAGEARSKAELLASLGVSNVLDATEREFSSFVDYDIRTDDGNWLSVACELNLVSDVVNIGDKYSGNIDLMNGRYTSQDGVSHQLFRLSENLDYELGCRGSLGDRAKEREYHAIREFFDVQYSSDHARLGNISPFILDFDLDFFTLNTNEGTMAWPLKVWDKHYDSFSSETRFVRDLIHKAMVITICREPDYCGNPDGIAGANYNLQNIDRYFFNGNLGTTLLF